MKKPKGNKNKINFTKEQLKTYNDYIIWFALIFILLIFLYTTNNIILQYIFLASVVVLLMYGLNETLKRFQKKKSHKDLKDTDPFLNSIRVKVNISFSLWIIGLALTFLSIVMLISYYFIINNLATLEIFQIISPFIIFLGFAFFFIGRFGKISFEYSERVLKLLTIIGIIVIILGVYMLGLQFLAQNEVLFITVFYFSLILGITSLFIEEIYEKNKIGYLLSLVLIGFVLFLILYNNLTETDILFTPKDFITNLCCLDYRGVINIISGISLMILFFSGGFYILKESMSSDKMTEKEEKIVKFIIKTSFAIWLIMLALFTASYMLH